MDMIEHAQTITIVCEPSMMMMMIVLHCANTIEYSTKERYCSCCYLSLVDCRANIVEVGLL